MKNKLISQNYKRLSVSERRFEDIYRIIFDKRNGELIMTEAATMTRKLKCTYASADNKIDIVARGIYAELQKNDTYIALCAENSLEWMVLFWAILKSGNKPYLVNLRQPASFTNGILSTLSASCVVTHGADAEGLEAPTYSYEYLFEKGKNADNTTLPAFADEFALSTSGTTLEEKICIYTGKEISAQLINLDGICKENETIVSSYHGQIKMLAFLPLYHVFGLLAMYLWYAFFGATFVFLPDLAPESILRTVRNHEVTHIFAVPLLWHSLEKAIYSKIAQRDEKTQEKFKKGVALSLKLQNSCPALGKKIAKSIFKDVRSQLFGDSVQFCISGGSFIKESTIELVNALGYTLVNGYGMSEIGIASVELAKKPSQRMLCSIGKPFTSVEYTIGDKGQLLVRGDSVCPKMIINGKEKINDGWFDTGDVVHADETGRYYIDGRISDIVFGDDGENLNPDFSEKAFSLSHANAFSVLGNADNSRLMLVVQIPSNLLEVQKDTLLTEIDECNKSLPVSYRVKEVWFTFDAIMSERAIKVSRSYLKKAISAGRVSLFASINDAKETQLSSGEDSELKGILRQMFADALGLPIEDIKDNAHFMNDLGGSSLDYFTLIGAIGEKFNIRLNYEEKDFSYTLNDFEEKIKDLIK